MTAKQPPKPKKLDDSELEALKRKAADLPAILEYAHSVGGFSVVPTEQGTIKSKAMNAMVEQTQDQMDLLFEQMKLLAKQAKDIKDRVQISEEIYHANIRFTPEIGSIYYLYKKESGEASLSLISPNEWGKNSPLGEFKAKIKLLSDHTWKILDE